jgi:uncharacterized protein YkwD
VPLSSPTQQQLMNQARASAGLPALQWSGCLAAVAGRHAVEMAAAGRIYHGDGVSRDLACGYSRSGENVGQTSDGIDEQLMFRTFMNSPPHRANILGGYRWMAAEWAVGAGGAGYLAVEFGG